MNLTEYDIDKESIWSRIELKHFKISEGLLKVT